MSDGGSAARSGDARGPGRPPKSAEDKLGFQIALRLKRDLVERLDKHIRRLERLEPAIVWSRGAAVRALMMQAMSVIEAVEPHVLTERRKRARAPRRESRAPERPPSDAPSSALPPKTPPRTEAEDL